MRTIANSPLIFLLATLCLGTSLLFSYNFLFCEETTIPPISGEQSPDEINDSHRSWIHQILTNQDDSDSTLPYTESYKQHFYLDNHCNVTVSKARPLFDKFIFIIIDALRVDFVPTIESPGAKSRLKFMETTLQDHGIGLVSVATIPTVTLPRVKAILSGTLPSFMDYILNLSAYKFQQENFVQQLANNAGKRMVFYGDDTWSNLFPEGTFTRANYTSSLFATDYTFVDLNVTWNVEQELKQLHSWDAMLLHYLGVDHIGHLRGFYSNLFDAKLHEMDDVFKRIYETIANQTKNTSYLFVVTGDHGMTNVGNHGGNTREETHTAAMFFSNFHHRQDSRQEFKNIWKTVADRTVQQIDIASTITSLFNLPAPSRSQGRIISSVLDRFEMKPTEHLCHLFKNSLQIQHLIKPSDGDALKREAELKRALLAALDAHYSFVTNATEIDAQKSTSEVFRDRQEQNLENAKRFYQTFLGQVQQDYVKMSSASSSFPRLILLIALGYGIVLFLLYCEWRNESLSILFWQSLIKSPIDSLEDIVLYESHGPPPNASQLFESLLHHRLFRSSIGILMMLSIALGPIFAMGSVNFLELEYVFWYYAAQWSWAVLLVVFIRSLVVWRKSCLNRFESVGNHYRSMALVSFGAMVLLQLAQRWKHPVITESDLNVLDVYNWITDAESKPMLGVIYTISLVLIVLFTPRHPSAQRPHSLFISSMIFVYLFRTKTGAIRLVKLPFVNSVLPANANFLAELVWWHVLMFVALCVFNRAKHSISQHSRIRLLYERFYRFLTIQDCSSTRDRSETSSLLYTFLIVWVIASSLLLEAGLVPVLMLNIVLEQLLSSVFSPPPEMTVGIDRRFVHRQTFYRLGLYHIMAFSSFYQLGNSNGLSTVNVNACFVGMESYQLVPCATFMIISMFSTFVYWILMFFVRLQRDLMTCNPDFTLRHFSKDAETPKIQTTADQTLPRTVLVRNYCTFYSSINCLLIIRLATQCTNLLVTLVLHDHLFIWSVICPKLLYELVFTALTILLNFVIALIFTHDDCFNLRNL